MPPSDRSADQVEQLARTLLGRPRAVVEGSSAGNANQAWRVADGDGGRYVLKIGSVANAPKWRSAHRALELAGGAALPVPELVHCDEHDGELVRVFTWIDGVSAADAVLDREQHERLLASVGATVAALHRIRFAGFSSRADGSAPVSARWADYLTERLGQIRARCQATGAIEPDVLDRACAEVVALAAAVGDAAEPVLCHRDLHPGNLIVGPDGALVGIVDWDAAEPWDRAGDWFKLECELLRTCPDRADVLLAAYLDGAPVRSHWWERRRIVHLVETLNTLPNVITQGWDPQFGDRARHHLHHLLAQRA